LGRTGWKLWWPGFVPDIGAVTVFLSHLSANNNTPELALSTFNQFITQRNDLKVEVMLASRQKESGLVAL
jgi:hypothetical protein